PHMTESRVLDHKCGSGDPYTLGLEEKYMLLDPETWDLVKHIDSMLARVSDDAEFEARINPELMQSVLEITTPVCRTAAEVADHLRMLRSYVAEIARKEGCRFASAGTHPFSLFERQRITAKDPYRALSGPNQASACASSDMLGIAGSDVELSLYYTWCRGRSMWNC